MKTSDQLKCVWVNSYEKGTPGSISAWKPTTRLFIVIPPEFLPPGPWTFSADNPVIRPSSLSVPLFPSPWALFTAVSWLKYPERWNCRQAISVRGRVGTAYGIIIVVCLYFSLMRTVRSSQNRSLYSEGLRKLLLFLPEHTGKFLRRMKDKTPVKLGKKKTRHLLS